MRDHHDLLERKGRIQHELADQGHALAGDIAHQRFVGFGAENAGKIRGVVARNLRKLHE